MSAPHRVVVLALEGVSPYELAIPGKIFGTARRADGTPLYEVVTCTLDGGPVRTDGDYSVAVRHDASVVATADTLIIPASESRGPEFEGVLRDPLAEVFARTRPGTRLVSICIASYVLAAAGLLDGRAATTHWKHAGHFQRTYPRVRVNPDVLFVEDGGVFTSAGAAAGVDLCLHLVRADHGSDLANRVARSCVVPPWRDGGQAQYIERPVPEPATASTGPTRAWALEHLDRPLTLRELASHAGLSVRTFSRRFHHEVGMSPGAWLVRQRVELARHLLETTDLTVDQIAARSGFGTGAALRQRLAAVLGVSPSAYRRTFRARAVAV
ncbi:MAG TPA: helix-turn-helix domain-containing protein [Thermomonospora sp.]|nr:helix-turn-helix domain-containing protein [Thermomonospora sp.]